MLFNSYIFLFVFLPITWLVFWSVHRWRRADVAVGLLLVASLIFYSYWNPPFVLLMLASISFNFFWGRWMENAPAPSRLRFGLGIAINLAVLGYFKYANFFLDNAAALTGLSAPHWNIYLPLGISFFTFQQITYLADCHKRIAPGNRFTDYALFVTFFPHLIAGPIVQHGDIMPQIKKLRTTIFSSQNIAIGVGFLVIGLFKKVVIADSFSPWVKDAFSTTDTLTFLEAWGATLAYAFQIYFDFSGYSDMAVGLAKLFNINLPFNFDSPYKAVSIIDFWRRWHITLSRFLRDFLYIPLGGNRKGTARRYVNLMITMVLGGLWHGAAWTFVLWGTLHGLYLCVNNLFRSFAEKVGLTIPRLLAQGLTFLCVCIAWVFFRAESMTKALDILGGMIGLNGIVVKSAHLSPAVAKTLATVGVQISQPASWHLAGPYQRNLTIICLLACLLLPNSAQCVQSLVDRRPTVGSAVLAGVLFCAAVLFMGRITEFLYFQF